jgi:hypothetical protein
MQTLKIHNKSLNLPMYANLSTNQTADEEDEDTD